jgi:hypothetical protein
MNFVVFNFGTACDNSKRVRQVIECTLLTKKMAFVDLTKHDILLPYRIEDGRFDKNVGHFVSWKNNLARTPIY